ncbi:MAG: SDR family NAD(P)-dependent oxidoreductase [Bdellovibrionales bacterium]
MHNPHHIAITGASSGIGAALALTYASRSVILSLHGRNAERLERIAVQARARGAEVSVRVGDVTDEKDMAAWVLERNDVADIDLLIANAGISGGTSRIENIAEQTKAIFATNVTGVFNAIHPVLPLMMRRRRGQIAIVASLAGFRGFAGSAAYAASKAAVRIYGEGLRAEMAPHGIEVNVVCPGFIKTPMTDVNPFHMPFIMSPERAARIICEGLACNRARIAFPWQMYALIRFLTALPQSFMDSVAERLPRK